MAATQAVPHLDLFGDPIELTQLLVNVPSVSGAEETLCDAIVTALSRAAPLLKVERDGNAVVAQTQLGRGRRVLLAGHLDTVPIAENLPSSRDDDRIYGCGTSDMKAALAVMLHLAATLEAPTSDLTFVFYDQEEVEASRNGLGRLARHHPQWLATDLAILMEPTNALVEAGCQGTLRVRVDATGRRAHSARSWLGRNAIHGLAGVLAALAAYEPRTVTIDGCTYREGLSAVAISGGVAGNVIPDEASVTLNFRFAPDRSEQDAYGHVCAVLEQAAGAGEFAATLIDSAPAASPHLANPAVADFVAAVGSAPVAKYGWTDVARFAALGIPALNYGPGDPNLAHAQDESVQTALITRCTQVLRAYLGA